MSLLPTSFQESSTTFNSGSAGLTAASFFVASLLHCVILGVLGIRVKCECQQDNDDSEKRYAFHFFSTTEFTNLHINFLFRLRQPRNYCGNFIELLIPALELTAVFRALHGFIANQGEFRPAIPEILKDGHVVRTLYRLIFYS